MNPDSALLNIFQWLLFLILIALVILKVRKSKAATSSQAHYSRPSVIALQLIGVLFYIVGQTQYAHVQNYGSIVPNIAFALLVLVNVVNDYARLYRKINAPQ